MIIVPMDAGGKKMNKANIQVAISHLENLYETESSWLEKHKYSCDECYTEVSKRVFVIDQSLQALYLTSKLVFCKECVHYIDEKTGWCAINSHFTDDFMENWIMFYDDDFCSYGERKDERTSV